MRGHAFSRGGDVCRARGGELQSREVNKQRDGHISISACMMCVRRVRLWRRFRKKRKAKLSKAKKVAKYGKRGGAGGSHTGPLTPSFILRSTYVGTCRSTS